MMTANQNRTLNPPRLKRKIIYLIIFFAAFFTGLPALAATTYNLPSDAGALDGNCSASGQTVTCSGDLDFGNNDIIVLESTPITLSVSGDLELGTNVQANSAGNASDFSVEVSGDIVLKTDSKIVGNVSGKKVELNSRAEISGDVTATDDVVLKTDTIVGGNVSGKKVELESRAEISGDIMASDDVVLKTEAIVGGNASGKAVELESRAEIGGDISASDDVTLKTDTVVGGDVTGKKVELESRAQIDGGITATDDVILKTDALVGSDVSGSSIELESRAQINGNVVANSDVELKSDAIIDGNVNAQGKVTLANNAQITGYVNANEIDNSGTITGETCDVNNNTGPCSEPEQQIALYTFEDQNWTSADPIADSSTNNNNASSLGSANILLPSQEVSCQVIDVPLNTSQTQFDGINTGLDVNDAIGNKGTISFWYRSDVSWSNSTGRQLFDASNENPVGQSGAKHFYLSLESGELEFGIEDEGDLGLFVNLTNLTFTANEWVHIAATWDLSNEEISVTVKTSSVNSSNSNTRSGISSELGDMDTLYIGDNRSGYRIENSSQNSANGQFDEVRIYNYVQTSTQIQTDADTVSTCLTGPLTYYQFEDANWQSGDAFADDQGYSNGSAIGNASLLLPSPQASCRALFIPSNTNDNTYDAMDTGVDINTLGTDGTISFWYASNQAWNSGIARQLFDASTTVNNRYFYLALNTSGELEFGMEDSDDDRFRGTSSAYSFAADEWVHIAVTWDLASETMQMFINGSQVSVTMNNMSLTDTLADFDTLYIGDNRSTYFGGNASSGNSADGNFDNVRIYDKVQSESEVNTDYLDVTSCAFIDHYRFEHDGAGLTCEAESIVIRACSDSDCDDEFSDQAVTVSLEPSGWVDSDTVTFTGNTTLQLSITDEGIETLNVVGEDTLCTNTSNGSTSCDLVFSKAGFEFYYDDGSSTTTSLPDIVAEADFSDIYLRAVNEDDATGACEAAISGSQDIDVSYNCSDPNECKTRFAGIAITDATGTNTGTVNLTFDADGVANLSSLSYADAGRLGLQASKTLDNGVTLTGSTSIDFYPAQLILDTSDYPSGSDKPIAGVGYDLSITAVGANDGVLPNYQPGQFQLYVERESPDSVGVDGDFQLISGTSQSSGETANFSNISSPTFSNGVFTSSKDSHYTEVGSIRVNVQDADYLGNTISSDGMDTLSDFIPAYFDVVANTPMLTDTCSTFTYIGEVFGLSVMPELTVTARNALGGITSNYSDTAWQLNPGINNTLVSYSDNNMSDYASAAAYDHIGDTPIVSNNENYDGSGIVRVENATFQFPKDSTTAVDEFAASINMTFAAAFLTDNDGVCYQTSYPDSCQSLTIPSIVGANMRYGRIRFDNAYGPETESLQVPVYAEHYSGNDWVLNTDDNCTSIAWGADSPAELTLTPENNNLPDTLSSDGWLSAGIPDSDNDLLLGAPTDGATGSVEIQLDTSAADIDHLNIDWNMDGVIDANDRTATAAGAIATFGQYRGNDRIIHWREQFR